MPGAPDAKRVSETFKSPLLLVAASFALGIAASRADFLASTSPAWPLALAPGTMLAGLLLLRFGLRGAAALAALAGFFFAGSAAGRLFEFRFPPHHVRHLAGAEHDFPDPARLEGRLVSAPQRTPFGMQFDLAAERLEFARQTRAASGKIRLRVQTPFDEEAMDHADTLALEEGDRIRVLARLHRPRVYRNPGSFDFRRWMEDTQDLYWVGTVASPFLVEKLGPGRADFGRPFRDLRRRLAAGLDAVFRPWSAAGRYGAVLKAALLGDRTSLDSETVENFRRTGLYHLLVISGLHVGLLALVVGGVLRLLPLGDFWKAGLLIAFLLGYAMLVEQRAPTLRATLMIFAYLLARFLDREQAALNAIGASALVLLAARPAWLFETGFQMSFAAVLIIAGLAVPILQRTTEPFRQALGQLDDLGRDATLEPRAAQWRLDLRALVEALRRRARFLKDRPGWARACIVSPAWVMVWIANAVLFSAVVQLGLMLPMAETFHRVTLVGVGLNALAMPLMTALLAAALPTMALTAVSPALAEWPGRLLAALTESLLSLTELSGLPALLSFRVPEPPGGVSAGFIVSLISAALALGRARRIFQAALATGALFLLLISIHPFPPRLPRGAVELTVLDCGGADALFAVLPDRTTMLVGACGSRAVSARQGAFRGRRWDPGEDLVSPYLWSRGLKRIDVVVFPRAEESLDGMQAVLGNFVVGEVWWPGLGAPPLAPLSRRTRSRAIAAGDAMELGGAQVEILWPRAEREPPKRAGDETVVLRISGTGGAMLFAGDIGARVERELLASGARVEAPVLKVARQGSAASSSEGFLERVRPRLAIISVEAGNRFGRPDAALLDRLKLRDARVFRTDRDGAVSVEWRNGKVVVQTYARASAESGEGSAEFSFEFP